MMLPPQPASGSFEAGPISAVNCPKPVLQEFDEGEMKGQVVSSGIKSRRFPKPRRHTATK